MAFFLTAEERFYDCMWQLVVQICGDIVKIVPSAMEHCVKLESIGQTVKPVADSVASMNKLEVNLLGKLAQYKTVKECQDALSVELKPAVLELNGVYDVVIRDYDGLKQKHAVVAEKVSVVKGLLAAAKSEVATGLRERIECLKWPEVEEFDVLKQDVILQKERLNSNADEKISEWKKFVADRLDKYQKRQEHIIKLMEEEFPTQ